MKTKPILEEERNWDLPATGAVRIQWHFTVDPKELAQYVFTGSVEDEVVDFPPTEPKPPTTLFETNKNNEIVFYQEGVGNPVKIHSVPFPIDSVNEAAILALRPRIELFEAPKTNLKDEVSLAELSTDKFEFMQGIFILAGIWDKRDIIFTSTDITSKLLDGASLRLTEVLNEKWNQGKDLTWKLKHTGTNGDHIKIEIEDPAVANRYIRPSLKSSGFQTYFLISMIVLARTHHNHGQFLYLFDEPGTYLHPQAQLDLQRTFEVISDRAQIIYTTHSLFLISKNYPRRNKVVSKSKDGTKIDQKPFPKNWKSVRESFTPSTPQHRFAGLMTPPLVAGRRNADRTHPRHNRLGSEFFRSTHS